MSAYSSSRTRLAWRSRRTGDTPRPSTTDSRLHANGRTAGPLGRLAARARLLVTQPVERGALPQLHAATAPGLRGGEFFGPSGFLEMRGDVTEVPPSAEANDEAVGQRLWSVAGELTGVRFL